jgi:hypothetical protein
MPPGAFGESNALYKFQPVIGAGPRGDRSYELSRHYPFDLLVLRGKTLASSGDRNQAAPGLLLGLPHGSGRGHEHIGPLFYPG